MFEFKPTQLEDLIPLAENMRPEDVEEVDAASGLGAYEGLRAGFDSSDECITIWEHDKPLAIFGYKITQPGISAVVWMLGSNEIFNNRIEFLRKSRFWVDYIHTKAPLLHNLVYHKNVVHIKWLRWLGFVFLRRIENTGVKGLPFIEFARLNHV